MIHSVNMPDTDKQLLLEIVDLQKVVVALASKRSTPFSDDGREIRDHLAEIDCYKDSASAIARWITAKKTTLFYYLNEYARYTDIDAKEDLCRKIESDVQLLLQPSSAKFQVIFEGVTLKSSDESDAERQSRWRRGLGGMLYQFYDLWEKPGFQTYLFKKGTPAKEQYTRADFIKSFLEKNKHLFVCPICDASAYRNETRKGTYTSIDHFFPRSKFPHLSIHPLNLVPMCPACNSSEARQLDPQQEVSQITEILLPYCKTDQSLAAHTYLKVDFHPVVIPDSCTSDEGAQTLTHSLQFSVEPSNSGEHDDVLLLKQIANFNKIYGVVDRWNKDNNLTLIDEHVFRRIRQFLFTDIERGQPLHNPQFLLERLELLMALIHQQGLGRDPFSYVMIWWLMHHINSIEKQKSRIADMDVETIDCKSRSMPDDIEPLFAELYCWAQEQQGAFKDLKEQATHLRSRIKPAVS